MKKSEKKNRGIGKSLNKLIFYSGLESINSIIEEIRHGTNIVN